MVVVWTSISRTTIETITYNSIDAAMGSACSSMTTDLASSHNGSTSLTANQMLSVRSPLDSASLQTILLTKGFRSFHAPFPGFAWRTKCPLQNQTMKIPRHRRLRGIAFQVSPPLSANFSRAHMEPDLAAMVLEAPGLFLSDLKRSRPLRLRGRAIVKYGYARVSTDDQTPALQLAALKKAGCKTVFKDDGISGATTKRPALLRCSRSSNLATP